MRFIFLSIIVFSIILFPTHSFSQKSFFRFTLFDLDNKMIFFTDLEKFKTTAIVFLLSDCPASQDYTFTLNELYLKYKENNITFIGIFPGKFSTNDELLIFQEKYKVKFPLLKDPDMALSKWLGVKIAPSCFLVDSKGNTVYKGRINDWLFALGKRRMQITQNDMENALKNIVKNQPVKIAETNPIGCILEY